MKYGNLSCLNFSLYNASIQNQLTLLNISAGNTVATFNVDCNDTAYKKGMYVFYSEHSKQQLGCFVMLLIKHAKEVYLVVEQVFCEMIPKMGVYRLYIDKTNSSPIKILKCS